MCDSSCSQYTSQVANGIEMNASATTNCHTVSSYDSCNFTIGDGGVTQIDFDFVVTDECHQGVDATEWLAFWIYSDPWNNTVEADFIESLHGPGGKNGGLNSNFAGNGTQVEFFTNGELNWHGHITAKFSGSGGAVSTTISNSHIPSQVASYTLTRDSGYFFVMDTATGSSNSACSFTVTNLSMKGTVPAGQCTGVIM